MTSASWLRFRETMTGEVVLGADDPGAVVAGGAAATQLTLRLTVEGEGNLLLADPRHEARLTGFVECGALGGERPILVGTVNLLTYDDDPDQRTMRYRIEFRDGVGRMLTLDGEKFVPWPPPRHPWRDTSTMFTYLKIEPREGGGGGGEVAAAGILRVRPFGVLLELVTMRASGISVVARFLRFFLGTLAGIYLRG